jgi:hypothetical protein
MTKYQIIYIIWIPLLVSAIGLTAVFRGNHRSVFGTVSLSRAITVFAIPSRRREQ